MPTKIEWTDETWNPTRGCSRVSEGCRNCYAERQAYRFSDYSEPFHGFVEYKNRHPSWTGKVELIESKLDEPLHWKKPRRIFVNSMSDLFHEALSDEAIAQVWAVMNNTPQHTYQILTKREKNMHRVVTELYGKYAGHFYSWPLPNVLLGVSVEDQATADARIPLLLQTPAAVRFVSYEPALGPVDFIPYLPKCTCGKPWARPSPESLEHGLLCEMGGYAGKVSYVSAKLAWIIVGGESGPQARPPAPEWFRNTRDQCIAAGVPFFLKQWGEWSPIPNNPINALIEEFERKPSKLRYADVPVGDGTHHRMLRVGKKAAGRLLDGKEWSQFPGSSTVLGRNAHTN